MQTRYFLNEDSQLREAAEIVRSGGLVAFPTETVYGLGGNALCAESSKAIYAAKGRPSDNPLIVHICEAEQMEALAFDIPQEAYRLAEEIWPGPLTMVLKKRPCVPGETTGGLDTVALRFPAEESAAKLIRYAGLPIAAPSANLSGRPSPTMWQHVRDDLDGKVDGIIMGPPCIGGIESTIVDLSQDDIKKNGVYILRPGLITPGRISSVLGVPCNYDPAILSAPSEGLVPRAPGMKYKHYAPKAEVVIYSGEKALVEEALSRGSEKSRAEGKTAAAFSYPDGVSAANSLFRDLRKADEDGADIIYLAALNVSDSLNYSVMNRMLKSAGYNITEL